MAERISLTEVVHKLQAGDESAVYFDRSTGRLLALEPTAVAPDGFEQLPPFAEHDEIEFARQFSETVEDAENRQRLRVALTTLGGGGRHLKRLSSARELRTSGSSFATSALVQLAKEWLESRQIPYIDDMTRAAD